MRMTRWSMAAIPFHTHTPVQPTSVRRRKDCRDACRMPAGCSPTFEPISTVVTVRRGLDDGQTVGRPLSWWHADRHAIVRLEGRPAFLWRSVTGVNLSWMPERPCLTWVWKVVHGAQVLVPPLASDPGLSLSSSQFSWCPCIAGPDGEHDSCGRGQEWMRRSSVFMCSSPLWIWIYGILWHVAHKITLETKRLTPGDHICISGVARAGAKWMTVETTILSTVIIILTESFPLQ